MMNRDDTVDECITGCPTVRPLQETPREASCSVQVYVKEGGGGMGGWGLQLLVCQLAVWLICWFRLYTVLAAKIGLRLCLRSAIRVNVSMIFLIIYWFFFSLYTTHRIGQQGAGGGGATVRATVRSANEFGGTHKICITCNSSNNKVNCSKQCKQCCPNDWGDKLE